MWIILLIILIPCWIIIKESGGVYQAYRFLFFNELDEQKIIPKKYIFLEGFETHLYKKQSILTDRETVFFRNLQIYIQDKDYIICPKVRVEDIIGIRQNGGLRPWKISGRLDRSHIDFVLIGKRDLKTKIAIELDDKTHNSTTALKRDGFKNEAFEIIGIPLIRITNPNTSFNELRNLGI